MCGGAPTICLLAHRLLEPKLVGDSVGMSPFATLISMFIGYRLIGMLGLILGIPVGMVIMAFREHIPEILNSLRHILFYPSAYLVTLCHKEIRNHQCQHYQNKYCNCYCPCSAAGGQCDLHGNSCLDSSDCPACTGFAGSIWREMAGNQETLSAAPAATHISHA